MFNRIVDCFGPNENVNYLKSPEYVHKIVCGVEESSLFRVKQRQDEEMEIDLSLEKQFDMIIELKEILIVLPKNGIYYQYFTKLHFILFIFIE